MSAHIDKAVSEGGSAATAASFRFQQENVAFVDFGCGTGNSLRFGQSIASGPGVGLDRSADAVAACRARGFEAHEANILDFNQRSLARVTLAIDLMPELTSRPDFERAFVNLVRAARDFSVIQHLCFDYDEALAARGEFVPANFARGIHYRPRISEYIRLVSAHRRSLNIVGLAIFGSGEAVTSELGLPGLNASTFASRDELRAHRSLRVVIGRKEVARFRAGLQRASTGDILALWEAAD